MRRASGERPGRDERSGSFVSFARVLLETATEAVVECDMSGSKFTRLIPRCYPRPNLRAKMLTNTEENKVSTPDLLSGVGACPCLSAVVFCRMCARQARG